MSLGEAFTLAAFLVGGAVFWHFGSGRIGTQRQLAWLLFAGLFGGMVGAKLTQFVAQGWPLAVPAEAAIDPRSGGRALLGGLVLGWLAVEVAKHRLGITKSTGTAFALALPAGEAVGRIGCWFNGCCYGVPSDVPWAVEQHGTLRHPAQLYSSLAAAGIFAILWTVHRRQPGARLFQLYLVLFAGTRLLLEFARYRDSLLGGLSPMQWFCIEILAVIPLAAWLRSRKGAEVPV